MTKPPSLVALQEAEDSPERPGHDYTVCAVPVSGRRGDRTMTKSLEVEVENDRQQVTYVTLTPETVRHLGVSHIGLLFDHAGLKVKPGMRVRIDFTVLP